MAEKKATIKLRVYEGKEPSAEELNDEIESVDDEFVDYIRREFLA